MKSKYDKEKTCSLYLQGLSVREVAKVIKGNHRTVAYIVKEAGISRPRRVRQSIRDKNVKKCKKLTKSFINFLDGLLISDGFFSKPYGVTKSSYYSQSCVNKNWLKTISNEFKKFGIKSNIKPDIRKGVVKGYILLTHSYDKLYEQRIRWYPNNKKMTPTDLSFTNQFLKNWIYGDGTLVKTNLRLCCDSFSKKELQFLIKKFQELGFKFNKVFMGLSKVGKKKYRLSLCKSNGLAKFYGLIGKCDVKYFQYKWYRKD